jgi:hypothetical protein
MERIAGFSEMEHGPFAARPTQPPPIHCVFCPGFAVGGTTANAFIVQFAVADLDSAQQ